MSKERFSVFATDVETGESRSTTQYLCVVCQERQIPFSWVHISQESPRVKVKVWLTSDLTAAARSKRGFVGVVTGLYTNEGRRHTYAETD